MVLKKDFNLANGGRPDFGRPIIWRFVTLLCLVLCGLPPHSTTVAAQHQYFTIQGSDFIEQTEFIFLGRLIRSESYHSEDRRFILTRYSFQVEESIKGAHREQLELVEYGGTVGDESMTVSHGPRYSVNQEYLVFCYADPLQQNRTLAGPLGKLPILHDQQGKRLARLYPTHPLLDVLPSSRPQVLWEIGALTGHLRTAVQRSSHAAD